MPFTLSHTVAAYPFYKLSGRRLPVIPLAVGCMAPDFSYFLEDLFLDIGPAHSIQSSFTKCLPVSLCILLLIGIYRSQFTYLLPGSEVRNWFLRQADYLNLRSLPVISLCVLLGCWTHLFWDAWTHRNGYFVFHPYYKLLQHASSCLGLGFIIFKIHKLGTRLKLEGWRWIYWSSLLITAASSAMVFHPTFSKRSLAFEIISCSIAYAAVLFLGTIIGLKASARREPLA